jgi:hypothetical protein
VSFVGPTDAISELGGSIDDIPTFNVQEISRGIDNFEIENSL